MKSDKKARFDYTEVIIFTNIVATYFDHMIMLNAVFQVTSGLLPR